jgi:hypothetical protein
MILVECIAVCFGVSVVAALLIGAFLRRRLGPETDDPNYLDQPDRDRPYQDFHAERPASRSGPEDENRRLRGGGRR